MRFDAVLCLLSQPNCFTKLITVRGLKRIMIFALRRYLHSFLLLLARSLSYSQILSYSLTSSHSLPLTHTRSQSILPSLSFTTESYVERSLLTITSSLLKMLRYRAHAGHANAGRLSTNNRSILIQLLFCKQLLLLLLTQHKKKIIIIFCKQALLFNLRPRFK